MRITNFNNTNFKASAQKAVKMTTARVVPQAAKHFKNGGDLFEKSYTAKEKELREILERKNIVSDGLASEFAKYEGDDYKFAKIITQNLKAETTGVDVSLDEKALKQISALNIECPIFKSWKNAITR